MLVRMQRNWVTHAFLGEEVKWHSHSRKIWQFLIK